MQLALELPKMVKAQISRKTPLQAHVHVKPHEEVEHVETILAAKEPLKPYRELQWLETAPNNFVLIHGCFEEGHEKLGLQTTVRNLLDSEE
jgi:hypothetical protein